MTLVIGIEHNGRVFMAGDSGIHHEGLRYTDRAPKVVSRGQLVIGTAGDARVCDIILEWSPPHPRKTRIRNWVITKFVPAMRKALTGEPYESLEVLLGVRGELFSLDYAGGVASASCGYDAVGAPLPAGIAFGNLEATKRFKPRHRLCSALRVATARTSIVVPPWTFASNDV